MTRWAPSGQPRRGTETFLHESRLLATSTSTRSVPSAEPISDESSQTSRAPGSSKSLTPKYESTTPTPEEVRSWLREGFSRALGRFEAVAYDETAPPSQTFIPLFEALNWAASFDDWIETHAKGEAKPPLLRAVVFARNVVHHEWVDALESAPRTYGEGRYGEGTYGGYVWRWRSLERIQLRGKEKDKRESLYRDLLEGVSVLSTLRELRDLLDPT